MTSLATPIRNLKGMRADVAEKFEQLGIQTLQDAVWHFPIRHEDWRAVVPFQDLVPNTKVTVVGQLEKIQSRRAWHRKTAITEGVFIDEHQHRIRATWFNQPYLATWLKPGGRFFLSGKVVLRRGIKELQQPVWQRVQSQSTDPLASSTRLGPGQNTPIHERLVPVYPATSGLSQWQLRKVLRAAIELVALISDPLPEPFRKKYDVIGLAEALQGIHFPKDPVDVATAVRRLKFNELLAWQIAWQKSYVHRDQAPAPPIPFNAQVVRSFVQALPFELTSDQRQAAWDVLQDLQNTKPMSRLIQGDVGSGKTVVAGIAAINTIHAGCQVVLLAPTVVLAQQHAATLQHLLLNQNIQIGFLSGAGATLNGQSIDRAAFVSRLAAGQIQLVIATHAVLSAGIEWHKLGLVIVDEQQRFGVRQRQALLDSTKQSFDVTPHFLSLTATPIPRTLALTVAGELEISSLKHKPPNRQSIQTRVIGSTARKTIDAAMQETLQRHEQVFVITPLIEESDTLGVRSATVEYDRLREALPHARIGLAHGSMPAEQRIDILEQFRRAELDVLVSTTVIEVGIDVPNATLMVIEGAERFGLSQLHQLRGRVGRGAKPSICLLATDQDSPEIRARLQRVAATQDGFAIAELDLKLRGAGDIYGVRQSGLPAWKLATLQDAELFAETREAATELLQAEPNSAEATTVSALLASLPAAHRE